MAAYWTVAYATKGQLALVHSLIAFDSPLQGISGVTAKQVGSYWSGNIASDLLHGTQAMPIATINDPRHGLLAKLPRILTIASVQDGIVPFQTAWVGTAGAAWNLHVSYCATGSPLCQLGLLHSAAVSACTVGWLASTNPRDSTPLSLLCPLVQKPKAPLPLLTPATTKVLAPATVRNIKVTPGTTLNGTASSLPITFSTGGGGIPKLQPGDVIVSGPSSTAPYGLLRKVTAVEQSSGSVVVQTSPASLRDAFNQAQFTAQGTFAPTSGTSVQAVLPGIQVHAVSPAPAFAHAAALVEDHLNQNPADQQCWDIQLPAIRNGIQSQLTANNFTIPLSLASADANLCFSGNFKYSVNMPLYQPIQTALSVSLQETGKIAMAGSIGIGGQHEDKFKAPVTLASINLGWIPTTIPGIFIVPKLNIVLTISGNISATFAIAGQETMQGSFTVSCVNSNCSTQNTSPTPQASFTAASPFTNPGGISGSITDELGPHVVFTIDGITGPEVDVDGYLEADVAPFANPWWTTYGGATLSVGYDFELFSIKFSYLVTLINRRWELLHASGPLVPPTSTVTNTPIPTNTAIPPTSTPQLPVGPLTASMTTDKQQYQATDTTMQLCVTSNEAATFVVSVTIASGFTERIFQSASSTVGTICSPVPLGPWAGATPAGSSAQVTLQMVATPTNGSAPVITQTTITIQSGAAVVYTTSVTISPNQAAVGSTVTFNGTGFIPGETVQVTINDPAPGCVPTAVTTVQAGNALSPGGPANVTGSFTVPIDACTALATSAGTKNAGVALTVTATGTQSNAPAGGKVVIPPTMASVTLSPPPPATPSTVGLTGSGFAANEQVSFVYGPANNTMRVMATADGNGNVSASGPLPAGGSYFVTVTGQQSGFSVSFEPPTTTPTNPTKPGGEWSTPMQNASVTNPFPMQVTAYPTNPGDPAIQYVNFTVNYPPGSNNWKVACTVFTQDVPNLANGYGCNVDMTQLYSGQLSSTCSAGAPPVHATVSFDVYDQAGNHNSAPNGEHTITISNLCAVG